MRKKGCLVVGMGFLFIVIVALVVAFWPSESGKLTIKPDNIGLSWISEESLVSQCTAHNESDEDWEGMVSMQIRNLDGKALSDYTTESWLRKKVKSGEKVTVYMKIPFEEIEGRYTDDTIVVYYSWGMYGAKKEFKL